MPSLPEASLSIIASDFPVNSTPWAVGGGLSLMIGAAYYASPQRLTRVLVDTMADVKKSISKPSRMGSWTFSSLQLEVSTIRQASLHSSLSHYAMLCDFLKGRTFSILRCIHELHELGTHIELNMIAEKILKESQREITSRRLAE
ncbi:hypothetical protein B0H14DRAFT_2652394 [Mycena olivaceomarginata]|nr:hypothetical protein B0H14DRAFT_2652394 [Mycena olivaceomarginata]